MYCPKPQPLNRLSVKSPKGKYSPSDDKECSTRISSKLDRDGDVEKSRSTLGSTPSDQDCSTRISRKPLRKPLSLIVDEQPLWEVGVSDSLPIGTRVCHKKSPSQIGTILKAVVGSTRYHVRWDAGSKSAVEGRNLSLIRVEQSDPWKLLITEPDYLLEKDGQLTIFAEDEPPDPDDFETKEDYLAAWVEWEYQYPEIAEAFARREAQTILAEHKIHIPAEQKPQTETVKQPKTRNTKPGRGSRPKQVNCNVKRNGSKGKSPNSYWLYQFSFKADGRYYNRSVSIPSLKVEQVISMWESKQYSWRDIVEFIGKDPDTIVDKARMK